MSADATAVVQGTQVASARAAIEPPGARVHDASTSARGAVHLETVRDFPCRLHDCCCANLGWCKVDCSCFPSRSQRGDSTREVSWIASLVRMSNASELAASPARERTSRRAELESDACHGARPPASACACGGGGPARIESTGACAREPREVVALTSQRSVCSPQSRRSEPPTPPPRLGCRPT